MHWGAIPFFLWVNMAKEFAKSFYNSKRWKDIQRIYKQMKFGICERCGRPNGTIVHHKVYLDETNINNPDIALNPNNLELLCQDCHNHEHHATRKATASGLQFNSKGELIKIKNQ